MPDKCILDVVSNATIRSRLKLNPLIETPVSQSWRFVTLEVRVISGKKVELQPLGISKNAFLNPLTFPAKEVDESVDCGGDTLVNLRI